MSCPTGRRSASLTANSPRIHRPTPAPAHCVKRGGRSRVFLSKCFCNGRLDLREIRVYLKTEAPVHLTGALLRARGRIFSRLSAIHYPVMQSLQIALGRVQFRRALTAHRAGRCAGSFSAVPADLPPHLAAEPLLVHFWTPHPWGSTEVHVERILPLLREQAAALRMPWHITSGPDLPAEPVDWLLCLKEVPPKRPRSKEQVVLLLNDAADRFWSRLSRFDHIVVVSSPVLASLVGTVHPHVWFIEESEATDTLRQGEAALNQCAPSMREPVLLWHGERESLDGLYPLRDMLETFSRDIDAELLIVTNVEQATEHWGRMRVRYAAWSPQTLASAAAEARLGIIPARPTVWDSYLKSAGRVRHLFALGCPAIGDARSPDVVAFAEACGSPSASTAPQWLSALHQLWNDGARLDAVARRGLAITGEHYSADRTARQWLWFLSVGARSANRASAAV